MSQIPPTGPSGQQWNLGKARPSSSRQAQKPAEKPPAEKAPESPKVPASEKVLDAILATEDNRPPIGRAVPESKGIRGALNHPLVMAGSGLIVVLAIVFLVSGGSLSWLFGGRSGTYAAPPTAEERAAALVAGVTANQSAEHARGRLLIMGGQIMEAAGRFMVSPMGGQAGAEEMHEYIPDHLTRMQMPAPTSPQFVQFRLNWDNQAQASIEMGRSIIRLARQHGINADAIRGLAARLRAEGLAILDDTLEGGSRSGVPGIDGARARLVAGTNIMAREEADATMRLLLADPLGKEILAARPDNDSMPIRVGGEGAAQP